MTVVFSAVTSNVIVMAADSAVVREFADGHREYDTGPKSFPFPGTGCVTTWGARDHNRVRDFLNGHLDAAAASPVDDLATLVHSYLTKEYQPDKFNLGEVGYHVAGFDTEGLPKLFHVFWGFDQPRRVDQTEPAYKINDHSPRPNQTMFLYNGRSDIAHIMVVTLLDQLRQHRPTRFHLQSPDGLVSLADFILRFACEITPEVGPPFLTTIISPKNEMISMRNDELKPLDKEAVSKKLVTLVSRTEKRSKE